MRAGIDYVGVSTAFYCTDGNGRFLFHKRSQNCRDECGKWDCGGGGLEFGLSLEENVLKEVMEELGCKGEVLEQLPAHSSLRMWEGAQLHWVAIPFIILVNPDEVKNNEPDKIDEIGWFSLDDLPKPMHPAVHKELETYSKWFDPYRK